MNKISAQVIENWIEATANKVLIAGYGSLLSRSSREQFSNIFLPTLPFDIHGWQRGWLTRASHEQQTYVGAIKDKDCMITTQLIPTEIDPSLRVREQDYRFVQIDPNDIVIPDAFAQHPKLIEVLDTLPIYICESLDIAYADEAHPVNFSYIATCLAGAEEADQLNGINNFLANTHAWDKRFINLDVEQAVYPRAANLSLQQKEQYLNALANDQLVD